MKPPIIAIEGENPSGVDAQVQLLEAGLTKAGHKVSVFKFPNYKSGSSYFIKEYQAGSYGSNINPYATSTFFALDRFDAQKQLKDALSKNDIILVTNYMGANFANQGASFTDPAQRKAFFIWLDGFETQLYGNIRPSHSFVVTTGSSSAINNSFKSLCKDFPKDYTFIELKKYTDNYILNILKETLPVKTPASNGQSTKSKKNTASVLDILRSQYPIQDMHITKEYITINGLNDHQEQIMREGLEELNKVRNKILKEVPKEKVRYTSEYLSVLASIVSYSGNKVQETVTKHGEFENTLHDSVVLPYSSGVKTGAELLDVKPKNQMTIVNDILFAVTDLSPEQIIEQTNKMPYEQKAKLIKTYVEDGHTTGLNNVLYTFNIGTSLHNIMWLKKTLHKEVITIQEPSPRNGYKIPSFAKKSSHLFEQYFDTLIELHSSLSNTPASRYLVALGNIASAKIKLNYNDIKLLKNLKDTPQIANDIDISAKITHPILYE